MAWLARPAVTEILARAHPQAVSVINRFALIAATLAMAIEANILPWAQADTDAAIIACMQRWLNQRGNVDAAGELLRELEGWERDASVQEPLESTSKGKTARGPSRRTLRHVMRSMPLLAVAANGSG